MFEESQVDSGFLAQLWKSGRARLKCPVPVGEGRGIHEGNSPGSQAHVMWYPILSSQVCRE